MNEIWVRTQKIGLINFNDVWRIQAREMVYLYTNIKKVPDEEPKRDFQIIITNNNENELVIATYSTMERALEVLDEIQEHIETRTVANEMLKSLFNSETVMSNDEVLKRAKKLSCVYEMPKE